MINFKKDITKYKKYGNKQTIYICVGIAIFFIMLVVIAMQLLKYHVEGETKLPFDLSKVLIISTADAVGKEDSENLWDLSILQNNDIYIQIDLDRASAKNDTLRKVYLENFDIINAPQKGEPKIYRPTNDKDLIYLYKEENLVTNSLEYVVSNKNNIKNLEISKDGGLVSFSSSSINVAQYVSNDDSEIKYDGTLLKKADISEEQVKYDINFDIIVEMESKKKYKATITLTLPLNGLIDNGTVQKELESLDNIVFKRI